MKIKAAIAVITACLCLEPVSAQKGRRYSGLDMYPDKDSVYRAEESIPPFGIFKDNYIITGTNFSGGRINKNNSDAKFQISIRHRLIKGVLPFHTYLFISYTQKSFWDIYKKSKPFAENDYNPTIGLGNHIVHRNKVVGLAFLQFEHESNGRDSVWSRSWNRISLTGIWVINPRFTVEAKVWVPMGLSDNPDFVQYAGYMHVAGTYRTLSDRFRFSAVVTKRGGWNLNANVQLEAAVRLMRRSNQFLFLQYYNGYAESMIDYDRFSGYVRIGFAIKPHQLSVF